MVLSKEKKPLPDDGVEHNETCRKNMASIHNK